ncbi:MAG: T9SS type A sorting domain-containing protein, partial [Calditrichaeota bacterium]|nr:T9SS type A sorting domain-containing protein [Calditrichota bacterium]
MVKTVEAIELVYVVEEELARQSFPYLQPSLLPNHPNTGENMSLLVHSRDSEGEVGVYSNGHLVGSGIIQNGKCGIAVWGDDPTTPELYGAISGAELEVLLHDGTEMLPVKIETMFGELKYTTDGFSVLRIQDVNAPPEMFGIVDAFPNPFNSTMSITYNLLEESRVSIALFDLAGRQIKDLTASIAQAGQHTISLEGAGLSSGVYVIQLQANGQVSKSKVTLVK